MAVHGDAVAEPDESFVVNLSGASGASLADATGVGTITNADTVGPQTYAPRSASVRRGRTATLYYRVTDNISASAAVTIRIRTRSGALKKTLSLGLKGTGPLRHCHFSCRFSRGAYRFTVYARDLSGNSAKLPLGSNRLTVR